MKKGILICLFWGIVLFGPFAGAEQDPACGSASVALSQRTFGSGESYNCTATSRLEVASVTAENGARLFLAAPSLALGAETRVRKGAQVSLAGTTIAANRALLGPLAGAEINAYRLADLSTPVEGPLAANGSLTDLELAGSFRLQLQGIPADEWILVTVRGGQDIDADDDGVLDATPTPNQGTIHALARARDWVAGGINAGLMSEIAWQAVKARVEAGRLDDLGDRLQWAALSLLDRSLVSGTVDYRELLAFDPANADHRAALASAPGLLDATDSSGKTLLERLHENDETGFLSLLTDLLGGRLQLPELTLVAFSPRLVLPENRASVTEADVVTRSLLTGDNQVSEQGGTLLVAEDARGGTLLLGYSLGGVDLGAGPLKELLDPARPEISPRSTVMAMLLTMAGAGMGTEELRELAGNILLHSAFDSLVAQVETTFQADPRFLDRLAGFPELVQQLQAAAGDLAAAEQAQSSALRSLRDTMARSGFSWPSPWHSDQPWDWYGDATGLNVAGVPFIAVETNDREHLAAANPAMVNYSMVLVNAEGEGIDWYLTPRNSTLLQKQINSGAAMRDFFVDAQIPAGTPHVEFRFHRFTFRGDEGEPVISGLNDIHLMASVLSMASSAASNLVKKTTDLADGASKGGKRAAILTGCGVSLANTVDFYPDAGTDSTWRQLLYFFVNNGTSLGETAITDCLYPLAKESGLSALAGTLKKTVLRAIVEAAATYSNPIGWTLVLAQATNDFIPFSASFMLSSPIVGYDLTWDGGNITSVVRNDARPVAQGEPRIEPVARFKVTIDGLKVTLDASDSIWDPKAQPAFEWGLGDGATPSGKVVTHTYDSPGVKHIRLTLWDGPGSFSEERRDIEVILGNRPEIRSIHCKLIQEDPPRVSVEIDQRDSDGDLVEVDWYLEYRDVLDGTGPTRVTAGSVKVVDLDYPADGIQAYSPYVVVIDDDGNFDAASCTASPSLRRSGLLYRADFSSDPGFTSLAPDYAYWDRDQGNYYVKTRDDLKHRYWAHSPYMGVIDPQRSDVEIRFDMMIEKQNWGTYPGVGFYKEPPLDITDDSRVMWVFNGNADNNRELIAIRSYSVSPTIDYNTLQYSIDNGEWYTITIRTRSSGTRADISVVRRRDGQVISRWDDVEFPLSAFSYMGVGYYNKPDYGSDYAPMRIDNIRISSGVPDLQSGLVAHYEFEGNADDSSGNHHDGVEIGGLGYSQGVVGQAASFDGVDGYIQIADGELVAQDDFSISVWVKPNSLEGHMHTIYVQNDDSWGYVTHQVALLGATNSRGETRGTVDYDNWQPADGLTTSSAPVSIGDWHHLVVTREGDLVKIYINGQLDAEGTGEDRASAGVIDRTIIGGRYFSGAPQHLFDGSIDEMRIYDRELSPQEISQLYMQHAF